MSADTDNRKFLFGFTMFETNSGVIRALLFGELMKLAQPIVKEYMSDFYHDSLWIAENVNGPTEFQYAPRTSGTFIGHDVMPLVNIGWLGVKIYNVKLSEQKGNWYVTIDEVVSL